VANKLTAEQASKPKPQGRVVGMKVFVRALRIEAEIGVYAHEHGRAQPLIADVELDVAAAGAEHLSETINYEMVAAKAQAIAASGHMHLVEAFAEKLARACLDDPRVTRARVRVEKPEALKPQAEAAGVEIIVVRG
jgi:7,8-dihydroneopterin aldolase/epimerase/oxygenase